MATTFQERAFVLQTLNPVQGCVDISDLVTGNYMGVSISDCDENILKKASLLRPTGTQADWHEEGLTAFIHFGMNTFYNQEWGNITKDPSTYDATDDGAFLLNTLYEVLTQYCELHELWFDGAQGNTGAQKFYDYDAFYDLINTLQPRPPRQRQRQRRQPPRRKR